MEQFRQVGEVLGSLKALMVLKDDIQINQRQCCLLLDMFDLAFTEMAEEIRLYLKAEEKSTKWKALEQPLRDLHRVFKEGEIYVKQCLDNRDWWSKAINLHHNNDCVEYHIHNLLSCFPGVIEAIESAGEISGLDPDEMQRRRVAFARKYDQEWNDPKLFQLRFGKEYLIPQEICSRFERAWKEDKWLLVEALREKRRLGSVVLTKNEQHLVDMLLKKINGSEHGNNEKLFPTSILLRGKDYQVRRRLGGGSEYKEIQWLGDSFAVRHFFGEIESLNSEISTLLSLSHPNILQYHCGFFDEEKKEFFLVIELMSKELSVYIKENSGSRRRVLFSIPVVVDLMLQIARGMEFLHSRKIYHGDLNPSNIFLKARSSAEGYFHVKISGFGLTDVRSRTSKKISSPPPPPPPSQNGNSTSPSPSPQSQNSPPFIWYAPEVLAEQEQPTSTSVFKNTEKADVYSFGMLCFELLTGKVPFEDGHLQGDTMARNIRAGERPLFPSGSPKYLVNLTKRCWHTNPSQRPSFSSICRILRYTKKFLVMNPEIVESFQSPLADYYDIEAGFVKKFVGEGNPDAPCPVSQIPFQMFAYRIAEKEKASLSNKDKQWELSSDGITKEDIAALDLVAPAANYSRSVCSDVKSVCFDHRSVYSEVPGKRISNFDMRSVCSEAPNKSLIRSITRPLPPSVPEKNIISNFEMKSDRNVTPERRISISDTRSVCSKNSDMKIIAKKTTVVKVEKGPDAVKARSAKTAARTRPARSSSAAVQSPSRTSSLPQSWKMNQSSHSTPCATSPGSPSRRKVSVNLSGSESPGSPRRRKGPVSQSGSESPGSPSRRKLAINKSDSKCPGSPSRLRTAVSVSGSECPGSPSRLRTAVSVSGSECPGSPSRLRSSVNVTSSESPEIPSKLKITVNASGSDSPESQSR